MVMQPKIVPYILISGDTAKIAPYIQERLIRCFFFSASEPNLGGCTLYPEVPWVAPVAWKWQHVVFVSGKERETNSEAVAAEHSDDHSDPHRGW